MGAAAPHLKAHAIQRLQMRMAQRKALADAFEADGRRRQPASARRGDSQALPLQVAEQLAGVGVLRRADHVGRSAVLLNFAVAKHQQAVGALRRQRQIVGDKQHRGAGFPAQGIEQVENALLYRDVEGAGGLVGND